MTPIPSQEHSTIANKTHSTSETSFPISKTLNASLSVWPWLPLLWDLSLVHISTKPALGLHLVLCEPFPLPHKPSCPSLISLQPKWNGGPLVHLQRVLASLCYMSICIPTCHTVPSRLAPSQLYALWWHHLITQCHTRLFADFWSVLPPSSWYSLLALSLQKVTFSVIVFGGKAFGR